MKNKLFKLSAFILSLSTVICSIPLTLAAAGDALESEAVDPIPAEDSAAEDENVPFIIGEDNEQRTESIKHFRLSDGSYLMVDYGEPVHYESDGDWLDIDNTLVSRDGRYENARGGNKVSFSADEYSDELYTLESDGHRLTLGASSPDGLPAERPSAPDAEQPSVTEPSEAASDDAASSADDASDDFAAAENDADTAAIDAAADAAESTDAVQNVNTAAADTDVASAATAQSRRATGREIVLGGFDAERSADDTDKAQEDELSEALSEARSTVLAVGEFIDDNPYATEEEISEIREEQNEKNMRQRAEIIGAVRSEDKIGYRGVFDGAALEYTLGGETVKEDIIISDRAQSYIYTFELDTELALERDGEGLVLRDGEQDVFMLPAPYMTDADGARSSSVHYSFERRDGGYTLTVTADSEWINAEERAFPVTVDPTVSTSSSGSDNTVTTDFFYDNDTAVDNTDKDYWLLGHFNEYGTFYNYIKFNEIPDVPYNNRKVAAYIYIITATSPTESTANEFNLFIQRALPNWREQITAEKSNPNPILDYFTFDKSKLGSYFALDVSGALDSLGSSGTGFFIYPLLSSGEQMSDTSYFGIAAGSGKHTASRPILALQYRNIMGTESYYTTRSASAGRAGEAYIGDYSGNLVLERKLASEVGVDISYVYNSRYSDWVLDARADVFHTVDYSRMRSAAGWRLNIQQSIVSKNVSFNGSDKEYLIYSDGDGTEHWFSPDEKESGKWKDEDGLDLTASRSAETITLTDEKDNKKVFRYGYLWYTEDANGNRTILLYGTKSYNTASYPASSGNCLSRVIYRSNSGSLITVADFEYTDSVLTAVVDRSGSRVTLTQSTSDMQLSHITDPDGKGAIYRYSPFPYRMTAAYDTESALGLGFSYYLSGDDYLTSYFSFYSSDIYDDASTRTRISEVSVSRSASSVTYTDKGHKFYDTSDDIITTVSFDTVGRTVSVRSVDTDGLLLSSSGAGYTANEGTSAKNNRLTQEGSAGAVGQNLLTDGGFERQSTKWQNTSTQHSGCSAALTTSTAHTGTRSMKLVCNSDKTNIATKYQALWLDAGTYTLSARVKTESMESASGKVGARILLGDVYANPFAESVYISKVTSELSDDGWVLLHCTYTLTERTYTYVYLTLRGMRGISYFDDVMLQKGDTVSACNLLENSDFSNGTASWTKSGTKVSEITVKSVSDGISGASSYALYVPSAPHKTAGAYQTVNLNISGTETLMLSAFAKACSAPLNDDEDAVFELGAILTYSDGTTDKFNQSFNNLLFDSWQHAAVPIVPRRPSLKIKSARVYVRYDNNVNAAYFDNFALTLDGAQCYTYDDKGNVVAVNRTNTDEIANVYSGADLISSTGGANGMFEYEYDSKHNVTKATGAGLTMSLSYDANGNATSTRLEDGVNYSTTSATYVDSGTKVGTVTDDTGAVTGNTYIPGTDLLKSTSRASSDAGGSSSGQLYTDYSYDSVDRVSTVKQDLVKLAYTYASGNLSLIRRGYDSTVGNCNQDYSFTYNRYGQRLSVSVGDRVLAAYSYDTVSHNLSGMTYGNDTEGVASYQYTYDRLDRMIRKAMPYTGEYFAYVYDYLGNVVEEKYSRLGSEVRTYHFEYDRLGRPVSRYETENGVIVSQSVQSYDSKGHDQGYTYEGDGFSYGHKYTYGENNGRLETFVHTFNGKDEFAGVIAYANLGRVRFRLYAGECSGRVSYTYQKASDDANRITSNMTSMRYTFGEVQTFANYTYDNIGNIKHTDYRYDEVPYTYVDYTYDKYNQLTKEVHSPLEMQHSLSSAEYFYDEFGNITNVTRTARDGKVTKVSYGYTDTAGWGDLLTSYDGHTITYDEIGNPLSYYNGWTYTLRWDAGRRLSRSSAGGIYVDYSYNKDGIRTKKTVSDKYTDRYILDGDKLVGLERTRKGSTVKDTYYFIYDEMGTIWEAICYVGGATEPVRYFYRTNAQGDVKQIVDKDNNVIAYYDYDAWGGQLAVYDGNDKPVSGDSHFANVNPFRYRGYIYDTETGFYYVTSRYYDPEIGRFINADDIDYLGADGSPLSYNLFAYCMNNPVNRFDDDGNFSLPNWAKITIGVAAIAIGVAATALTGGAAAPVLIASLKIAATSTVIGAVSGAGISAMSHHVSTGSWEGVGKAAVTGAIDGACDGFMWGGISAGTTFTTIAAKGAKIQQIGKLKPTNKSGKGYHGVQYKNQRGSLKSFELHSPHKSGPHQQWHWQQNTWNPKTGGITGRSIHWTLFGRRF